MDRAGIMGLIQQLSEQQHLPWQVVAAIVQTESHFDPWAVRYEPSYHYLYGPTEKLSATERMQQMTSWGLMQVMGAVAREHGFTDTCTRLCIPSVGLYYGILHLAKYHTRWPVWTDAIASYNAGSPKRIGELYMNQGYVDKVTAAWKSYEV